MIPPEQQLALDIDIILQKFTDIQRKDFFSELNLIYCFICGEYRDDRGGCSCLRQFDMESK